MGWDLFWQLFFLLILAAILLSVVLTTFVDGYFAQVRKTEIEVGTALRKDDELREERRKGRATE